MYHRVIAIAIISLLVALGASGLGYAADDQKLDLNKATVEQLSTVPGMNRELAERIIELREENGEFVDIEELLDVDGIDNKLLRLLKQHVYIDDAASCNC